MRIKVRKNVVIDAHSLLTRSITFFQKAVYAGALRVNGLALPEDRIQVVEESGPIGRARECVFRQFALAPRITWRLSEYSPVVVHTYFRTSGPAVLTLTSNIGVPLIIIFRGRDTTMDPDEMARSRRCAQSEAPVLRRSIREITPFADYLPVLG